MSTSLKCEPSSEPVCLPATNGEGHASHHQQRVIKQRSEWLRWLHAGLRQDSQSCRQDQDCEVRCNVTVCGQACDGACVEEELCGDYRGTSLIKNATPLGPQA